MTSVIRLVSTRWEYVVRRSMEDIAGCLMPGWDLYTTSSIMMEVNSGQPMPNGNQPVMQLVLGGTIASMVTIKGKSHIAGYMRQGDIFLNTNPRRFGEMLGLPTNHQIMDSPLALSRKRALAKENSIIVSTPIRLLSALVKRHPEWYHFTIAALLHLVAYYTHREYQFLTMSTEERYLAFLQKYPHLAARISQREVAQYLGLTPVGLNRAVSRLRQRGAIPRLASRGHTA